MNKTYKYTLSSGEKKEITFDVGVQRLAISNANDEDGGGGATYTAGDGIAISEQNVISNTAKGNTDIIAEEFDATKTYNVGDYCIYNNKLYRCKTKILNWVQIPFRWGTDNSYWRFASNIPSASGLRGANYKSNGNTYGIIAIISSSSLYSNYENWVNGVNKGRYSLSSNSSYAGSVSSGYYLEYELSGVHTGTILEFDGYYNSKNEALSALFSNTGEFDASKWEEVTVTDEIKSLKVYSTEERVVGTWIDGKPLYEKVIVVSRSEGFSTGEYEIYSDASTYHLIPNGLQGMLYNSAGSQYPVPWIGSNNSTSLHKNASGKIIFTVRNDTYSDYVLEVIIRYTKTTD